MSAGINKNITIIGAGLVGSLLSIYLARRGYKVSVYERRGDTVSYTHLDVYKRQVLDIKILGY